MIWRQFGFFIQINIFCSLVEKTFMICFLFFIFHSWPSQPSIRWQKDKKIHLN